MLATAKILRLEIGAGTGVRVEVGTMWTQVRPFNRPRKKEWEGMIVMIRTIKTVVSVITVVTSVVVALTELKKAIDGFRRKKEIEGDGGGSRAAIAQTT